MARNYLTQGSVTNTASATLPLLTVTGAATIRPMIYDYMISGNATPADNYGDYTWQRATTAGTAGSSFTPLPLDPADPASLASSGLAVFSGGPTLTASTFLGRVAVNQRATFRWVAAPGSELKIPATANNGLALMCLTTNSAFAVDLSVYYSE